MLQPVIWGAGFSPSRPITGSGDESALHATASVGRVMAGRPQRRQREREAAEAAQRAAGSVTPRAKAVDVATRFATVQRAAVIGDAAAAAEIGIAVATVRSWRRREKKGAAVTPSVETMPELAVEGNSVEQMRATAARARDLADEAARRSQVHMRAGEAIKVRELSAAAKMWAATAASLEQAIAISESAAARLEEGRGHLMADVVRTFFEQAVGSFGNSTRSALAELVRQAGAGEPLVVPRERAAAVRSEIRAGFALEIRREITEAERDIEQAPHGSQQPEERLLGPVDVDEPVAASSEGEETDEPEPDVWEELPEDWKRRYKSNPALGEWEWRQACRREQAAQAAPPPRESRYSRERFTASGLDGGVSW